jgi:hypothetical protein
VRWDEDISRGNVQVDTPHFGCFYEATPRLAKRWVKNLPEETHQRLLADQGLVAKRKLRYYKLARAVEPQARVVICTPSKGFYHRECALSLRALSNVIGVDFKCEVDLEGIFYRDADVVRARSLLVSLFLRTDATHLLFLDDDISFTPDVVLGMLRAGKDFVAAPYPRRDELRLSEVRKNPNVNELVSAYRYTLHPLGEELCVMPDGTAEVKAMPLGCALLSRNMLEQMTAHFANSLRFSDKKCGDSVALFSLIHEGDQLWSEDHSFCLRWRALGGKVWMYLGEGSPVTHHGSYAFRGSVESFGVRRA